MTLSLDFAKLSTLISSQTLILTPNARTQKAIYSGQLANLAENQVVESVDVRSFSQWQNDLWSELSFIQPLPKTLSNLAIKSWLEKLVRQEPAWTLTNPSGVANKLVEAYQNLLQWRLCLDDIASNQSAEIDYFKIWIAKFEIFCKRKNLIAAFATLDIIALCLDKLMPNLPKQILLVGFNQLTPNQKSFFDCLKRKQIQIDSYIYQSALANASQIGFTSLQQELGFAASYAKKYQQKDKCVGIVVEQLASHLAEVHRAFSDVFQPEESKPWVALGKPKYNVSAGFALSDQPLVKAGLLLLNLKAKRISLEELHFLKNTPFIEWGTYRQAIQFFLQQLCLNARKNYSISFLLKSIEENVQPEKLEVLKNRLLLVENTNYKMQPITQHIKQWRQNLSIWGWAEFIGLNEFEIQAKNTLLSLIGDCDLLNDLYDKISSKEAIDFLNQSSKQLAFQIASDRTNIHILGVLEASGLQFDHLVVVGFNANNWPQKNKINPFIPLELQREKNMPGSSAEREFEYARDLSSSLLNSAKHIIVTSSDSDTANSLVTAPFFAHLPLADVSDFIEPINGITPKSDYIWVDDSNIDLSTAEIRGGAYLLSDYAKCPFKSIATFQLKLSGYQSPDIGVEPKTKGSWLHETMELIWQVLGTQRALLEMPQPQLEKLVLDSLQSALLKHQAYLLATTDQEIIELEQNKLASLIFEWLKIEKERADFSVHKLEAEYELNIEQLNLKFRVDRIDSNGKEQLEIIDYKTGKTEVKNWFGVRPTEAQMPAYILSMREQNISGLNYARLKTGEVAQSGLSFELDDNSVNRVDHYLNEIKSVPLKNSNVRNFDDLTEQWQKSLARIATGISNGYMSVSPKDKNQSCLYCDYKAICRINEPQPEDVSERNDLKQLIASLDKGGENV